MDDNMKKYLQGIHLSKRDLDNQIYEQLLESILDNQIYEQPLESILDNQIYEQPLESILDNQIYEQPLESRLEFTPQRNFGRRNDNGTTSTEVLYTRENWRMASDSFEEYQRFIEDVTQIEARRLGDEDAEILSGDSFRGTDVFLLTLALYATGSASGIRDYSTYNPENRRIEIKHILSTPTKSVATGYSNKYVEKDGEVSESFRKIEEPIFKRVLSDNGAEEIPMPDFMLQPVVVGLGEAYRNDYEHKGFEGVAYNSTPNISTLNLLARLTGIEPQQFSDKYPILSSKFKG